MQEKISYVNERMILIELMRMDVYVNIQQWAETP